MKKENFITFPTTKGKIPKIKDFTKITRSRASRDFWGIQCGKLSNLLVIDVDTVKGSTAFWDKILSENPPFSTATVKTPSGGLHYYFKHREGMKNYVSVNGLKIDIRTTGGFVMGFGSKGYKLISDVPLIDAPEWLLNFVKPKKLSTENKESNASTAVMNIVKHFSKLNYAKAHGGIKSVVVDENSNTLITMKRITSDRCEFCDRVHMSDNTAFILICDADNKVMYGCNKKSGMKYLKYDQDLIATIPGEKEQKQQKIEREKASKKAINAVMSEEKIDKYFKSKIGEKINKINNIYCGENMALNACKSAIIAIKSNTGTGKTNAIARIIKEKINNGEISRVLIQTFRIGQIGQLKNDKYRDIPNLSVYSETPKINNTKTAIICQVDSTHKIHWNNYKDNPTALIIDEANQIKKQFTCETYMKNPTAKRSYKRMEQLVRYSKNIYIMDAHLTPETLEWFCSMRDSENRDVTVFINEFKKDKNSVIQLTDTPYDILNAAENKLKDGQSVYIACNGSTEKIDAYADILKKHGPVLTIHRGTLQRQEVKNALNDPNGEFGKYKAVIVSPSIQSGLSYDMKNIFHSVYGIFGNYTSSSSDCIQMLDRVRNPISNTYTVSINMGNNNIGPTTRKEIQNGLKAKTPHLYEACANLPEIADYEIGDCGNAIYSDCSYFDLFVENTIIANKDKKLFMHNFLRAERAAGFALEYKKGITEKKQKMYKQKIAEIMDTNRTQNAEKIAQVISVSDEEINNIREKMKKGQEIDTEELLNIKKDVILQTYNIAEDELVLKDAEKTEWFKKYGDKKIRQIFINQKRIFSHDTFDNVLGTLKKREAARFVAGLEIDEQNAEAPDTVLNMAMSALTGKYLFQKWSLLFSWLCLLGYNSINDAKTRTREDINIALVRIRDKLTREEFDTLDRPASKFNNVKKLSINDPEFIKKMKRFINGSLLSEFGVSIVKTSNGKNKDRDYILRNVYIRDKIFTVEGNQPVHIPQLKYITTEYTDYTRDPTSIYDSDDEQEDEEETE